MGCDSSNLSKEVYDHDMRISVTDSAFMKKENEEYRDEMERLGIQFDFYISLGIFFQEFDKRYYNEVVCNMEDYPKLHEELKEKNFQPNIYIVSNQKSEEFFPQNVYLLPNYSALIQSLNKKKKKIYKKIKGFRSKENRPSKNVDVKILWGPNSSQSQADILQAILDKGKVNYEKYKTFNQFQNEILSTNTRFVLVDYIYHRQTIQLVHKMKVKVICYCSFDEEETYAPEVYFVSDNSVEIANQIKKQIEVPEKYRAQCSKVYLYQPLMEEQEEIEEILEGFDLDVRKFLDPVRVIRETAYFFSITILVDERQSSKLRKYFVENDCGDRTKFIGISKNLQRKVKDMRKIIKEIKSGYRIQKKVTKSVDIIDKHYQSQKFEEIKQELENNNIEHNGYRNIAEFVQNKKFISPYIICNYQERFIVAKYINQMKLKSKIIIFCNKKKISTELLNRPEFVFANCNFGKILKYLRKNPVYQPVIFDENQKKMQESFERIQNKNKRISAIKWCGLNKTSEFKQDPSSFEFLNVDEKTITAEIKDIQKSNSALWKYETNFWEDFQSFKENLMESLKELRKNLRIQYPVTQFQQMLNKIKPMPFPQLLMRTKDFFESNHEFGLILNESLINLGKMNNKDISYMREFIILASLNFISFFKIPAIGTVKLKRWASHQLFGKCQIGSYLLCKQFLVMYDENQKNDQENSEYKIEIEINFDTMNENDLIIKPFFIHKNKYIFSPYTEFKLEKIEKANDYKILTLKYISNSQFLQNLYKDNFLGQNKNLEELFGKVMARQPQYDVLISQENELVLKTNYERILSIHHYKNNHVAQSIQMHEKLIQEAETEDNFCLTVNDMKFELACFLNIKNNTKVASVIKDLMESNPNAFVKNACKTLINEYKIENDAQNKENKQEEDLINSKTIKSSQVGQKLFETFQQLQNEKNSDSQSSVNEDENMQEGFQIEIRCMDIKDLEEDDKDRA